MRLTKKCYYIYNDMPKLKVPREPKPPKIKVPKEPKEPKRESRNNGNCEIKYYLDYPEEERAKLLQ